MVKIGKRIRNLFSAQFCALFKRDIICSFYSRKLFYLLRMLIPFVSLFILYVLPFTRRTGAFTGIPNSFELQELTLPPCFVVASEKDRIGLGAIMGGKECRAITFSPNNPFTQTLMKQITESVGLKDYDVLGIQTYDVLYQRNLTTFFHVDFLSDSFENYTYWMEDFDYKEFERYFFSNFQVLVTFNQTYVDLPEIWHLYNKQQLGADVYVDVMVYKFRGSSSLPMVLQAHILDELLAYRGIHYNFSFRPTPYKSEDNIPVLPTPTVTKAIFLLIIVTQFVFCAIQLQYDKASGQLDALRLAGVQDLIYLSEFYVFQMGIYALQFGLCFVLMYGLPCGNDLFAYMDPTLVIAILFVGGIYSTSLALLIASFSKPKAVTAWIVVIFAVMLCGILCFEMIGTGLLYDPSIIPMGFFRTLLRYLVPYFPLVQVSSQAIQYSKPVVRLNVTSFDYAVYPKQKPYTSADFFSRERNLSCSFKQNCTYSQVAQSITLCIPFWEALVFGFLAWMLYEYMDMNASACRPFWKVLSKGYFSQSDYNFSISNYEYNQYLDYINRFGGKGRRYPLSEQTAHQCLEESGRLSDDDARYKALEILTQYSTQNEVLITHHLHKTFLRPRYKNQRALLGKYHRAVRSVSLRLLQGEISGIAGHNGAGKSTTISLISGSIRHDAPGFALVKTPKELRQIINNAWLDNRYNLRDDISKIRRYLGYCPYFNTNVYQELTVRQNLKFMCELQNIPTSDHDRLISSALMQVGLLHEQNSLLAHLSGGMQRRISIAMAVLNPKKRLFILDEPTTGLDPSTKRVIWSMMKQVARVERKLPVLCGSSDENYVVRLAYYTKPAVMLTSHDMDELNTIADSISIMADGQVVTTGTALELKRKYGKGWTLTVVSKSPDDNYLFRSRFEEYATQHFDYSSDAPYYATIRIVDCTGSITQIAISAQISDRLDQLIRYIEELIATDYLIDDYCLERTSLDEVFITVGKLFYLANGGDDETESYQRDKGNKYAVRFADKYKGSSTLTYDEVQRILSPQRQNPKILKAMLYKMSANDKIIGSGIIRYLIIPFIAIIIAYLMSEQLVPWAIGKVGVMAEDSATLSEAVCNLCSVFYANGLTISECEGWNSFGYAGVCEYVGILRRDQYEPPITWFGGDDAQFEPESLYDQGQYPYLLYVFDARQNALSQKSFSMSPKAIAYNLEGISNDINFQIYGISMRSQKYQYFDGSGKLGNTSIRSHHKEIIQQYKQKKAAVGSEVKQEDMLAYLPVKTVAIYKIDNNNQIFNRFDIMEDLICANGFDLFESTDDLDYYLTNFIRRGKKPKVPILRYRNCYYRNTCLFDDDYINIYAIQKYIAQNIPYGYISINSNGTLIYSFLPARQEMDYNYQYRTSFKIAKSTRLLNLERYIELLVGEELAAQLLDQALRPDLEFKLAPNNPPTVLKSNFFDALFISSATQMIDIMTRYSTALMRTQNNTLHDINFYMGITTFPHTQVNFLEAGGLAFSLTLSVIFLGIATLIGIYKYGAHIVEDRQTGMRKSLYLNGVSPGQYWGSTILYTLLTALCTQLFILIFGAGIFQISTFLRMDPVMILVHALCGVFSSVATSLVLSLFFYKIAMFSAACVVVILLSLIVVLINPTSAQINQLAYILPSIAYVSLFVNLSYNGTTFRNFVGSQAGYLYLWSIIESVILILLAVYFDNVLPINGYCKQPWTWPFVSKRASSQYDNLGVANRQAIRAKTSTGIPIDDSVSKKVLISKTSVNLLPVPQGIYIHTSRDIAAAHDVTRMDIDVEAERELVATGVAADTPIIVSNLQKRFGGFLALRDMTFHVPNIDGRGCIFALLGPNGAAKTTTINMMTGLLEPTRGGVFLHQRNMADRAQAVEVYRNLGLCSQFDIYLPDLSVRQHLVLFAALHGVAWADIDNVVQNLARFVCLENVLEKRVGQLSGGMKRRMSLALALIG